VSTPGSAAPLVAAFVAPYLMPATVRFVATAAQLPGVRLAVVTTASAEQVPPDLARHLAGHWRVDDALDPRQIADAVAGLARQLGPVRRLVGALEQLQVPLAQVREALGIPGTDVATAHNVRDKARMKSMLSAAGVPCARHRLVADAGEAFAFAATVGFPLVVSGGHSLAQAPAQLLIVPLSAWNRYSVRPLPSTRTLPSFVLASATDPLPLVGFEAVDPPP